MVGIISSAVAGAVRDFVHNAEVPLIVTNAGNDDLTGPLCSPVAPALFLLNGQISREMGPWMAARATGTCS